MTDQEAFENFYKETSIMQRAPALAPDNWIETYLLNSAEAKWIGWQAGVAYIKSQTLETVGKFGNNL